MTVPMVWEYLQNGETPDWNKFDHLTIKKGVATYTLFGNYKPNCGKGLVPLHSFKTFKDCEYRAVQVYLKHGIDFVIGV